MEPLIRPWPCCPCADQINPVKVTRSIGQFPYDSPRDAPPGRRRAPYMFSQRSFRSLEEIDRISPKLDHTSPSEEEEEDEFDLDDPRFTSRSRASSIVEEAVVGETTTPCDSAQELEVSLCFNTASFPELRCLDRYCLRGGYDGHGESSRPLGCAPFVSHVETPLSQGCISFSPGPIDTGSFACIDP